jgi:hypothetical protein
MIRPQIRDWLNLKRESASNGFAHGGMDGQALRFEGGTGDRKPGTDQADQPHSGRGGPGRCIAEPFAGSSRGEGFGPGVAVLAGELAGLSRTAIHLGALSRADD